MCVRERACCARERVCVSEREMWCVCVCARARARARLCGVCGVVRGEREREKRVCGMGLTIVPL